jgi:hypothetical protein
MYAFFERLLVIFLIIINSHLDRCLDNWLNQSPKVVFAQSHLNSRVIRGAPLYKRRPYQVKFCRKLPL